MMLLNKFLVIAVLAAVCSAAVVGQKSKTSIVGVDEAVVRFMEENDFTTRQKMEVLSHMKRPARYILDHYVNQYMYTHVYHFVLVFNRVQKNVAQ